MAEIATPPPAPAAPAAPAKPAPAPSPAPAAAPAPSPAPSSGGGDPVLDFDKRLTDAFDKASPLAKKPDAPPEPAKPAEPAKPEPPKPDPNKVIAGPKAPPQLRAELDRVNGELATKSKQVTDLEAKIKDAEAKGKETATLTERLGTLEKQLEEKESQLRALKQETSDEYRNNYEVPFQKAANRAKGFIETLDVTDPETNATRKGSLDDLVELTRLYRQSPNKALARGEQLFGDKVATLVMPDIKSLDGMEREAAEALAEEKANWKQRTVDEEAKHITQRTELGKLYEDVKKQLAESVDDYHDDPTDKELNGAREEAFKLFDAQSASVQDRILKNAHIRHRFAMAAVEKLKRMRAEKQVTELKAELETYKNDPPDPGRRRGGKESATGNTLSWEEDARKSLT